MDQPLNFILLADRPEAIPLVAGWYFDEWARLSPEASVERFAARFGTYLNRDCIPLMVLAVDRQEILGVAELKFREMDIYPEKEHWLGGVFVPPAHRGRGIASRVAEHVASIATRLGVTTLHLQTERLDGGLYARLGWRPVEQVNYHGHDVLVMERQLGLPPVALHIA